MIQTLGGLVMLKRFEGLRLTAYLDLAGVPTIGYGHTQDVFVGMVVTEEQATTFLLKDIGLSCVAVESVAGARTTDRQFSAMVSLAYNIGNAGFGSSTVLRQHRAGNLQAAADAFLLWDKATVDGVLVTVPDLDARRTAERMLYMTPDQEAPL